MLNVGEQLVSSYLRYIRECDFVQTNLYTIASGAQGEIDVVGVNLKEQTAYICEVAIHLTTGLQYVKDKRPNNVQKLTEKFSRDIEYAKKYLREYNQIFMLWSPIVRNSRGQAEYNQRAHLTEIRSNIQTKYGVELQCVVNEAFEKCLTEMREFAGRQTVELQCPLMRLFQIEHYLSRHVKRSAAKNALAITPSMFSAAQP